MGRHNKPVERQRLAGNPGKRRLPEPMVAIQALERAPSPPAHLAAGGRGLWSLVWRTGLGWLAPSDTPLVALLCEVADERAEWRELVAQEGRTYRTAKSFKVHPGVTQIRSLEREMVGMLSQIGFSPSDRARLGLAEVKRMAHLSELITKRRREIGR